MKLSFALVGGAGGFIGNVHRTGATLDNLALLKAGCFSRDDEKNLKAAELWNVSPDRAYKDYAQMIEKESNREDKVDFIVITTPNITHYEIAKMSLEHGFHVVCDKPVAMNVEQALELEKLSKDKNLLFGVTYTYAHYAMVIEAQQLIKNGEIGNIINIMAEYPQDWGLVELQNEDFLKTAWRYDPKQAGNSAATADIGTHLIEVISRMTGLKLESVLANFQSIPASVPLDTNTQVLLKYENDIPGMLWASQVAIGYECTVKVRVFGDRGSVEWDHLNPNKLLVTKLDQPTQIYTPNRQYLSPRAKDLARLPYGHPEGFFEVFANIYRDFCTHLLEIKHNLPITEHFYSNISDGVEGMKFVQSCVESNSKNNIWVKL